MKRIVVLLSFAFFAATSALLGESPGAPAGQSEPTVSNPRAAKADKKAEVHLKPFSALAFGGGMSLMGVNLQAATNMNRYLNLRGTGNFFNYTANNISTNGFNLNGTVNMATAGVSVDYYPFPSHGFRLSPGALFYNQNQISAIASPTPGTSITLNSQNFYADSVNPINASANLGLNTRQKAFTMTTGWGNMIPRRRGGHISFPFELGAAFTGVPTLAMTLSGNACTNQADVAINGPSCVNMATNALAQSDLAAQLAKWKSDLNPLQAYPILSFGIAYDFHGK
ncbi:MAG: hypothetical protein WAK26_08940 [Terracidiphilus sp.]